MLARRARDDERGFTLIEAVFAMGVILVSMLILASSALVGFRGAAVARQRQAATGIAERLVEQVRALPSSTILAGLKDADLTGDTSIISCGSGVYKLTSCTTGEAVVHSSTASTAPLYPHTGTLAAGYPTAYSWKVYLTQAAGLTGAYRLTVNVAWTVAGQTQSVQPQTLLSFPDGTYDPTTSSSGGGSSAYFYGTAAVSPGNVVITPNGTVSGSGVGVASIPSSQWTTSGNLTQSMYALTAELAHGQLTKVNGQSTLTSTQNSGGTAQGGATTFSIADDDTTTSGIGTTDTPTAINQTSPSITVIGGGNSLSMSQYSTTTTTTTTTGSVTKRSSQSASSSNGSITIAQPSGLAVNDLMLLQLSYQGSCMSTPSGWTLVRCDPYTSGGNTVTSSIFYRFATSSNVTSWNGSFSTGSTMATYGGIIAYTGADPTANPIDASTASSGSGTTASTGTLNVNTGNARLVSFFTGRGYTTVTPVDPGTTVTTGWAQNWSGIGGTTNNSANAAKAVGGASAGANKKPPGGGQAAAAWTATLSTSALSPSPIMWVAQMVSLSPQVTTTTTTTTGAAGTETGSAVSATQAVTATGCGSPTQNDGLACAYAAQSYAVPASTDGAFFESKVDLTGSGLGTCSLYKFSPPSTSPTNYAYGHRGATSGDGKLTQDVKRYYGTHTFGGLCSGTGNSPAQWPGYFVKYDAGTTACQAIAQSGISASAPSKSTAGTITVWNGSGTTSLSVPTSGTWSTAPTTVSYTSSTNYHYDISASLASGSSYTTSTSASGTTTEARAVVGAPVIGYINYKLTSPTNQVLIDLKITIDLGTLTSYAKYTPAA